MGEKRIIYLIMVRCVSNKFNPSKEGFFFFLNQTSVLLYQEKMCIIVSPDSYYFPHPLQVSSVSFNRILAFSPNLLYRGAFLTVQVTAEQLVLTQKNQRVWVDPVLRLVGQAA